METRSKEASFLTIENYNDIRKSSEVICAPLEIEDYVIQGMEDVSPPKWHLAHTTWFFEKFILIPYCKNYKPFNEDFIQLFNSYYHKFGNPNLRAARGLLSRPTVKKIYEYRSYIDNFMFEILKNEKLKTKLQELLFLGLNHEQQHQELLLMDIKFNYSLNQSLPIYKENQKIINKKIIPKIKFIEKDSTFIVIGQNNNQFCFDNEKPEHKQFVKSFAIANRLITNQEYLEFIEDGGYKNSVFWLSDGWDWLHREKISAPLYWQKQDSEWFNYTLHGFKKLNLAEPVAHISFYEADAFARWQKKRLPTEFEWEAFVKEQVFIKDSDNFLETYHFHPLPILKNEEYSQFYGDVWEWTSSPYLPYPGYKSYIGMAEEYNGKFMCNQWVLRGGACVTPKAHIRSTYRNFYKAENRWQFSGIRLAQDIN